MKQIQKISLVFLFLSLFVNSQSPAANKSWIVLFKAPELTKNLAVSRNINRAQMEKVLRGSNQKAIQELSVRLKAKGVRSAPTLKKDLWIIRGMVVQADDVQIAGIRQDPNTAAVLPDRTLRWIHPIKKKWNRTFSRDDKKLWGLKAIKVPELRDKYGLAFLGQGVRAGILDTGIQSGHREFASVSGPILFKDFINNSPRPYDDNGHGTHVAGIMAGRNVGVAPQVSLVVGKMMDASGSASESTILEAMQWMFDPDGNPATPDQPQVVNNSWGMSLDQGFQDIRSLDHFRRALKVWVAGGIVPVFAAGNSGGAPNAVPAGLPEVMAVGSFNIEGRLSSFSSWGPNLWTDGTSNFRIFKPDCSAPGEEIYSASPDNGYVEMDGTSMAAPYVAGSVALLLQVQPKNHPFDSLNMVTQTTVKKGDLGFGIGTLDAMNLVTTAMDRRGAVRR